ncbi:MAG: penicillin-binding protein 2 [bacterium]
MRQRLLTLFYLYLIVLAGIILRLSYWQLVKGPELRVEARSQYETQSIIYPSRGEIITADGYPLVVNRPVYNLSAYIPLLSESPKVIVDKILPLLKFDLSDPELATDTAKRELKLSELKTAQSTMMLDRLSNQSYAILAKSLSVGEKNEIDALGIAGLNFDESFIRGYPEASMSAHLTGFVGRDELENPVGYFGLEGYYNLELTGRTGLKKQEKDAIGNPLLIGNFRELATRNGRTLKLYLERSVQYLIETELQNGLERYGAVAGEVVVMDPETGGILASVALPSFDPLKFYESETVLYKNPVVANSYEPGSTFKVMVMAAAINEGKVALDDHCDVCSEPLPIDKYLIKTWNGEYHPDSTPQDIIVNSDNVGMVWAQRKLGGEKLLEYLKNFGFGEKTGIDLQEEITPSLRSKWGEVDYATTSFGQGIAVTSIQMVRAVAAIANGGKLLEPHVVQAVIGDEVSEIKPKVVRQVISAETAEKMTDIMIAAAEHGDAKWTRLANYTVAGKTGTAQIPVLGHYDTEKTIASFVGFAPAHNPRFVMLVKLREPTSSPWGSETAAPLWFNIARKLLLHYNIPPDLPQ